MGYYTEIIFGARLKKETPKNIIDTLRYVANGPNQNVDEEDPVIVYDKNLIEEYDLYRVMRCASYYFGVCDPVSKMWFDKTAGMWVLSFRSNCKNGYVNDDDDCGCLEKFTKWIKPYIRSGSGGADIYSIITTEDGIPRMYGVYNNYKGEEIKDE